MYVIGRMLTCTFHNLSESPCEDSKEQKSVKKLVGCTGRRAPGINSGSRRLEFRRRRQLWAVVRGQVLRGSLSGTDYRRVICLYLLRQDASTPLEH